MTITYWMMKLISNFPNFKGKGRIFNLFKKQYLKSGSPIVKVKGELGELKIDLRSFEWIYFCTKRYDSDLMKSAFSDLDVNEVSVDVGANIGFWTIAIAQHIKKMGGIGKVFAFEAHPKNYERLIENIYLNGLSDYISAHNIALSDNNGTLQLVLREDFENGATTGNASISVGNEFDKSFSTISVEAKTADDLFSLLNIKRVGFVKIDIEGHEDFFFRGAEKTLRDSRPTVLMEVNIAFYKARGVDNILDVFNSIFQGYLFYNGNKSNTDLHKLVSSDIENIIAKPI